VEPKKSLSHWDVFAAMFLVAGTCIGGGMLALPVATGVNGFIPSIAIMFTCWLAMTASALLLLEASLWMEEGVHIITMTTRLLGKFSKVVSWVLFLFISYASIVAYTAGGGVQIASFFAHSSLLPVSKDLGALLFLLAFGAAVYMGNRIVGRVNSILFIAMIAAYIALVGMGVDEIKPNLLLTTKWAGAFMALPLLLTSFSFQTMVPSLTPLLHKHKNALRMAIIGGTSVTFVIYALWQMLILGIVPANGPESLAEALVKGEPPTQFIRHHVEGGFVAPIAQFFAFFAIATSFLGIALGLFDFLSDGLKIPKKGFGSVYLALLIVIPSIVFATQFERIFLLALDTTGGYGDTILNGLFPVLMVWIGRYRLGYLGHTCVPGGKPVLVLIFCFFFFVLLMEILAHTGQITSIYNANDLYQPDYKG